MIQAHTDVQIRRSEDRGRTRLGWLDARHSFSFGEYVDPNHMGFRSLRVINEDRVAPGGGFGEHPHRDMEIITWVIEGELAHRDNLGNGGTLHPGEVQVMTAGAGIRHSEINPSSTEAVHLLQIWIRPGAAGLAPAYAQRTIPAEKRDHRWATLASPDAHDGALTIHQDAFIRVADLNPDRSLTATIHENRHAYLHIVRGKVRVGDHTLNAGDAMTLSGPAELTLYTVDRAQALLFDLA